MNLGVKEQRTSMLKRMGTGLLSAAASAITVTAGDFVVDIADANGEVFASLETTLKGKWLEKPLAKALIEPALVAAGRPGAKWARLTMNGLALSEYQKAATYVSDTGQVSRLFVTLKP